MVASKTKKTKWTNVGISPDANRKLEEVCRIRGWSKVTAVERMTDQELAEIEREQRQEHPAARD